MRLLPVALFINLSFALVASQSLLAPRAHAFAAHQNYNSHRPGTHGTWVVTSFGDSIAAGFCGFMCTMDAYPQYYSHLNPENISTRENVDIDGRVRAVSGYTSQQILDWIDLYRSDVQQSDVLTVEACGNDFLPARRSFQDRCDEKPLLTALETCKENLASIYDRLLHESKPGVRIRTMNLYYPAMNADRSKGCGGRTTFDAFLHYVAEGNYYACELARQRGIPCVDSFAEMNVADADRDKVAWIPGESLEDYRTRVTVLYKHLLTDPADKVTAQGRVSYIQSDNTHPSREAHSRLGALHLALGLNPTK
jgi:lysophospholipase L1-like esterase